MSKDQVMTPCVTEAMIAAGVEQAFDQKHRTYADMCRAIYEAMSAARTLPLDGDVVERLFGEFGVFKMARAGWLSSNSTDKVQEVAATERQLKDILTATRSGDGELRPDGFVGMHFKGCDYFTSGGSKPCSMDCCS